MGQARIEKIYLFKKYNIFIFMYGTQQARQRRGIKIGTDDCAHCLNNDTDAMV